MESAGAGAVQGSEEIAVNIAIDIGYETESFSKYAVVATITASQYVYFYVMRYVEPSLSKEVDKAAESADAEMGGGKDLAEDNYVVVIAGIGLVEVIGHSSSEWAANDHRMN